MDRQRGSPLSAPPVTHETRRSFGSSGDTRDQEKLRLRRCLLAPFEEESGARCRDEPPSARGPAPGGSAGARSSIHHAWATGPLTGARTTGRGFHVERRLPGRRRPAPRPSPEFLGPLRPRGMKPRSQRVAPGRRRHCAVQAGRRADAVERSPLRLPRDAPTSLPAGRIGWSHERSPLRLLRGAPTSLPAGRMRWSHERSSRRLQRGAPPSLLAVRRRSTWNAGP